MSCDFTVYDYIGMYCAFKNGITIIRVYRVTLIYCYTSPELLMLRNNLNDQITVMTLVKLNFTLLCPFIHFLKIY